MDRFNALMSREVGGKFSSTLEELTPESLDPGEVTIQVEYSGINYKDALGVTGKGRIFKKIPIVGGIDLAGEILHSESDNFKVGQKVLVTGCGIGELQSGGYSELARVPKEWVVPLPEGLNSKEAMIFGTAGFTAALCLFRMEMNGQKPDKGPIVVTGASGGVGQHAVELLSHNGYEVIAVSGKTELRKRLKELGATEILNPTDLKYEGRPLEKGLYGGAIDNVGKEILPTLLAKTRLWGNVASVGLASGHELGTTVMPFILRGVSLLGVSSANCPWKMRIDIWKKLSQDWKSPNLSNYVTEEVGLNQILEKANAMLNRQTHGRILVKL